MPLKLPHRIVSKKILSVDDIAALHRLAAICEVYEHTRLRISWGMLQTRPGDFPLDFMYYDDGKIVGYLALDDRGVETKELFGMVHPAYRRQGIFQLLFQSALDICYALGIKRLVIVCERASPSGQAFVKAVGASYDFSEHEMVLVDFCPRRQFDGRFSVRVAGMEDIAALAFVQATAFDDTEEVVRQRITTFIARDLCRYYLLQAPGQEKGLLASVGYEEPVGSLRVELGNEISMHAFGIHPAYRGRGYGRQMLEEVIHHLRAEQDTSQKAITLDVETDNVHALSLYHTCGFRIRATYDYYNCYP